MPGSLFSSSWYRVAAIRPRLRSHVEIHRQRFRGRVWYVLQDHASGRFHRFSPAAHLLISMMDGDYTVQEIWEIAAEQLGDNLPTQDEVIQLLGQLHGADALHSDVQPDVTELSERSKKQRRTKFLQSIKNPLAVRLPLLDPDRFLGATLPLVRFAFGPTGLLAWLVICITALVHAGVHWAELTENIADRILAAESILALALVYPVVKALHELGHGYAVKRWGGEVHEMGFMFLVLIPVPYVDATAASAFREKWRRAFVGAAGIMVEMFLASIALFVWLNVEPGMVRALAFNVMLIGGVSTLLFNGNPLLRFDGYYVLADLIEIPNLAARSNRYLAYLAQRHLFGMEDVTSPATARGERAWFVFYGIAAFVYRLFIMLVIVLFVATKFFFLGVIMAIWSCLMMYGVPLGKMVRYLFTNPQLHRRRRRALAITGGAVVALLGIVLLVPMPYGTVTEGVVWVPERSRVYAATDGFVARVLAPPDRLVARGEPLIALEDPLLDAQVQVAAARVKELEERHAAALVTDLADAQIIRQGLDHAKEELALARQRVKDLTLPSPSAGRLVVPGRDDLPARYVRKGALMGYVVDDSSAIIRVVVPQTEIDLVRGGTRRVEVRLADRIDKPIEAEVVREVPGASTQLPSMALSTAGGGSVVLDPNDPERRKALNRLFQLDLRLPSSTLIRTIGGRAYVRFDHGREAIAWRLFRQLRQILLSHFNV